MIDALVAFSHLRWDCVHQRPQQILTRLARKWRVLFVEEPRFHAGDPRAELHAPANGVTVLTPHTPLTAPGFHDDQIPLLSKLIATALARERIAAYGAWLSTPMALPLLRKIAPRFIVYDCVDEPSAVPDAPRQLVQREHALMRIANAVLCAGPSLYEARRDRHSSVHHVAGSIDRRHRAPSFDPASTHPDVKALSRPRIGYAGVVDARVDLALVRCIAAARPEWEICLAGPVVGIEPSALPQAPNLHYFGHRKHAELRALFAGWDVAILPFAQDPAARFRCPATTALEYMAGGCSIVSTPMPDIARLYGRVVRFGATHEAFVSACDAALLESAPERLLRHTEMKRILAATSWDDTVQRIQRVIDQAAQHGLTSAARRMLEPARLQSASVPAAPARAACLILGAGATGLSAAYHHGAGSLLLERESAVGGGCRSIEDTGFTFDYGGHVMASDDPYVQELYRLLLGDNVHWQETEAWMCDHGEYARYAAEAVGNGVLPSGQTRFGYPLRGGFQALMDGFLPLLRGDLLLHAEVRRVSPLLRTVTLADGRHFRYETLVSTLPLPVLVAAMGDEAPAEIRRAAAGLRHASMRCVNLGVARPRVTDKHWIDFRGDTVFNRVFAQGNASPHCNPPGGFGLACEIRYSASEPLPATGAALIERCVRDCGRVGLLDPSDALLTSSQVDVPYARVLDDPDRAERVERIREWLSHFDVLLAGPFGEWECCDSRDPFLVGRAAAAAARHECGIQVAARSA